jgi:glutaminase
MNYREILQQIESEVQPLIGQGHVADYIPALKTVDASKFGMAVCTVGGEEYSVGAADDLFSIQSISKTLTLTLALDYLGDDLWKRVGKEVSGNAFNSIIQLEYDKGIPRNPLINAGALIISDCILSHTGNAKNTILKFVKKQSGNQAVEYDFEIAESEKKHGYRNAALANFMKSFDNIDNEVTEVLDVYFHQCALAMSCQDLARTMLFLANNGISPITSETIISPKQAKKINSLLLTCGMYDAVGDFAYRVGLPAKSGVGGGIVAIVPGQMSICVWSPALDKNGNSFVGGKALELFTNMAGCSIFLS